MSKTHPSKDIKATLGSELEGRRIALCMTGSVAIIRSVDLGRLLMRHGAEVFPVLTEAAAGLIGPDLIEWATGNKPVLTLTGGIEHVALAGNVESPVDAVIVAPATANTIGKIAGGIDDTPVTTVVTTALGQGIPLLIVPAMHEPMYRHPIVMENIEKLQTYDITVMKPSISEGKAKIPSPDEVYEAVLDLLGTGNPPKGTLSGKKVLITAGRTVEYIDPIRVLTNNSSGKMGMAVASAAGGLGAEVTVVYGKGTASPPERINVIRVDTSEDMKNAVHAELSSTRYDIIIAAAAVGDWKPKEKAAGKISTHDKNELVIELVPTTKIIDSIRKLFPDVFLVAFRALHALSETELIENAVARMGKADADMIAVNDVSHPGTGFETDTNEMYTIDREGEISHIPLASKQDVAAKLMNLVADKVNTRGSKH
ncbi:MAG: bifunctional phosphopantothenoylcysteine decarboxylase/phosphopantothenate--cysteine ligase CoaBC [Spirochaetales bacterium]|jgi:phosphopantothenoylcysteine decarboxylase / phosphopantothenate---cysteine ligase|nr:bifunctional phosphopantothenoylcysteine decarboxylase/phosphopantothenate--cysteine ligase CoaBC [Spirochaetales bacterium]